MRYPITARRQNATNSPLSLFDKFFSEFFTDPIAESHTLLPRVNVAETDSALTLEFELPGVKAEALDIEVLDNRLVVKATREMALEADKYHAVEHHHGEMTRQIVLPRGLDTDAISATFENGLLTIEVPKTEPAKARKIEIKR
ncbi:MAG: Hsp20/alpha crystallin family protein [Planctomycetes bacterium]|nr:Hsp20/alpha crystallin family protein [Planctomycetota bacterium]